MAIPQWGPSDPSELVRPTQTFQNAQEQGATEGDYWASRGHLRSGPAETYLALSKQDYATRRKSYGKLLKGDETSIKTYEQLSGPGGDEWVDLYNQYRGAGHSDEFAQAAVEYNYAEAAAAYRNRKPDSWSNKITTYLDDQGLEGAAVAVAVIAAAIAAPHVMAMFAGEGAGTGAAAATASGAGAGTVAAGTSAVGVGAEAAGALGLTAAEVGAGASFATTSSIAAGLSAGAKMAWNGVKSVGTALSSAWGALPEIAQRGLVSAGIMTAAGALSSKDDAALSGGAGGVGGVGSLTEMLANPTDPMAGTDYTPPDITSPEISPWEATEFTPRTGFDQPDVEGMPVSDFQPTGVSLGERPAFNAEKFSQELDDLDYLSQAQETGDIEPYQKTQIGSLQQSLAGQWTGLFQAANADLAAKEERQIQTLVENVTTDWGGQFQKGIASLVARGLSHPGESTTSDKAVASWVQGRDRAIIQGIRDIQNANSDRRLQLAMYGMETATDLGKFDITTALQQEQTGLQARGQDITVRGQDITSGESAADRAANLAMFGITSKMDLAKAKTAFEFEAMGMDADVALANAGRLQDWAVAQQNLGAQARGQDIQLANMIMSGEITAAQMEQNWAQFQGTQATTARGQDIDIAGLTQRGEIAEAGMEQDWARFGITTTEQARQHGIDTAVDIRGQDVNANLALAIANMERGAARDTSLWNLGGELVDWSLGALDKEKVKVADTTTGTANKGFDWSGYTTNPAGIDNWSTYLGSAKYM